MQGELKDKVARGVAWSMAEKIGSMLLTMGVRLVILGLLTPEILGFMAVPTAIVTIALVVIDSGFSQNLVRHKSPSQQDYKAVFLFNMLISALLYVLIVGIGTPLANYYNMPAIAQIAPVFFLMLPLSALSVIQNTIYVRQFRFALLSKVTFFSSLVGGLTAIGLALAGYGIWCLVAERIISTAVRSSLLWWFSDWRPSGKSSIQPLRTMAPFSFRLLATDLISAFYGKIPQFFLGKLYTPAALGSFEQAVKLKDMPTTSAIQSVQSVTYPAFAKIKDDPTKLAESYRQVLMIIGYVMFPLMLGMSAVAHDLFAVFLGEEWMSTVPYFEVVCLAGLFYPIAMIAYNILKIKSDGRIIVRLEIIKKAIMTGIFALTIFHSVQAVVWGLVAIAFCEMAVNCIAAQRFVRLTIRSSIVTMLPIVLTSVAMYALVRLTAYLMVDSLLLRLMTEVAVGAISYLLLSLLFRLEAFREVMAIIKKQVTHLR